ncbi:SnoaL-like domain-containing protein [Rubrivirga sp. IMCC45206]|uniref:SnoaL-like domain-containing protein n=1 Tax=Rubrivirga sp. IMCC45206 TaxID=3391614 RepID=UPI00398FA5E0
MTLLEQAQHLQDLASGPDILEAVDTYYANDIQIVDFTGETPQGKETQKERIRQWLEMVETVAPGGGVQSIAAHETAPGTGVVFVETSDVVTFKDGTVYPMDEVAVQRWQDGKVVHERFYHTPPGATEA